MIASEQGLEIAKMMGKKEGDETKNKGGGSTVEELHTAHLII